MQMFLVQLNHGDVIILSRSRSVTSHLPVLRVAGTSGASSSSSSSSSSAQAAVAASLALDVGSGNALSESTDLGSSSSDAVLEKKKKRRNKNNNSGGGGVSSSGSSGSSGKSSRRIIHHCPLVHFPPELPVADELAVLHAGVENSIRGYVRHQHCSWRHLLGDNEGK